MHCHLSTFIFKGAASYKIISGDVVYIRVLSNLQGNVGLHTQIL